MRRFVVALLLILEGATVAIGGGYSPPVRVDKTTPAELTGGRFSIIVVPTQDGRFSISVQVRPVAAEQLKHLTVEVIENEKATLEVPIRTEVRRVNEGGVLRDVTFATFVATPGSAENCRLDVVLAINDPRAAAVHRNFHIYLSSYLRE